jgi:hypothetical protein
MSANADVWEKMAANADVCETMAANADVWETMAAARGRREALSDNGCNRRRQKAAGGCWGTLLLDFGLFSRCGVGFDGVGGHAVHSRWHRKGFLLNFRGGKCGCPELCVNAVSFRWQAHL